MDDTKPCPCGGPAPFASCCEPIIDGTALAQTAEAMMRSRYSAYALGRIDHIEKTNAPETRPDFNRAEAERMAQDCAFQSLKIKSAVEDGDTGTVEFSVFFHHDGLNKVQTERSYFRREKGEWFYVDSDLNPRQMPVRVDAKIGRNDPCPCGSGKKHKKCCGAAAA